MASLYDEAKVRVSRIQELYDDLVDAVEAHRDWAAGIVEAEKAKAEPDAKLISAVGLQVRFPTNFLRVLEEEGYDEFQHFADRVIRIKHYEDGVFI